MDYIGLLTDEQKRAGYFTSRDEDFVYLFCGRNGNAVCLSIWPFGSVTIKEVVGAAEAHLEEMEDGKEPFIRRLGGYRGGPK